jgi:hypothetical protein
MSIPNMGGTAMSVTTLNNSSSGPLVAYGTSIYLSDGAKVYVAPATGGAAKPINSDVERVEWITASTSGVYWTTVNPTNAIMHANLDGTGVATLLKTSYISSWIDVDSASLFFYQTGDVTTQPNLYSGPLDGSTITRLFPGIAGARNFAMDASFIYGSADLDGVIFRFCKTGSD